MAEKKNGCLVAVVLACTAGVLFVLIAVLGLRGCMSKRLDVREAEHAAAEARAASRRALIFDEDDLPRPEPHQSGRPLSRRAWLAWSLDTQATEFAKNAFREAADGSPVSWELRTQQVFSAEGGRPVGVFGLPVTEKKGDRETSSVVEIKAEFEETAEEGLLSVRRGDWVRVVGKLSLRGSEIVIEEARISAPHGSSEPAEDESR